MHPKLVDSQQGGLHSNPHESDSWVFTDQVPPFQVHVPQQQVVVTPFSVSQVSGILAPIEYITGNTPA